MTDPGATKTRILDAAESLFAERGYEATSMRNITAAAGVNLASVNYHFGGKESLLFEVLARRLGPINEERSRLLDEAEAGADPPDVAQVVRMFLVPAVKAIHEAGERGMMFVRVIGRAHSEPNENIHRAFMDQFKETLPRFALAFHRALPQLSKEEVRLRMFFMVGSMAHSMAWAHKVDWLPQGAKARARLVEALVEYTTAGMRGSQVTALEQVGQ